MIRLELKDEEKTGLTEDEKEVAMARKLEMLIIPYLRRNIEFFYAGGNLKGKALAYNTALPQEKIENSINAKQKIATVCKPLCNMVVEILRENGLDAKTISCDTDMFRHVDVLLTTKAGNKYIINYLEDIENMQTYMATPNFASKRYYERRYQKFEGETTTDGTSLDKIKFITPGKLNMIDRLLGYKRYNMYMNEVVKQIANEFKNYEEIAAENEWMSIEHTIDDSQKEKIQKSIYDKYKTMTFEEKLESKLDWLFNYFNGRMDINGHTDLVMYHSRLLLKKVLSKEEYSALTRYDCFAYRNKIPENSRLEEIFDYDNPENFSKVRFYMIQAGEKRYAFSTKHNAFVKLGPENIDELNAYCNISKAEKPSDLIISLEDRGNALPLIFNPIGTKILNERAEMIDPSLSENERNNEINKILESIVTTDEPVTSITLPYPDGTTRYLYIDENNEFALKEGKQKKIYHYNEGNDQFSIETIYDDSEIMEI